MYRWDWVAEGSGRSPPVSRRVDSEDDADGTLHLSFRQKSFNSRLSRPKLIYAQWCCEACRRSPNGKEARQHNKGQAEAEMLLSHRGEGSNKQRSKPQS